MKEEDIQLPIDPDCPTLRSTVYMKPHNAISTRKINSVLRFFYWYFSLMVDFH